MDFTKLIVYTTTEGIDPVTGIMLSLDINGFEIEDKNDFLEFISDSAARYDYIDDSLDALKTAETTVSCYLAQNDQGYMQAAAIEDRVRALKAEDTDEKFGRLAIEKKLVREEDWADNWKQYFKPFPVGERLYVKPSWEEAGATDGRHVLEIDPGSSFGTGQHETTKLCLELIDEAVHGGERVLDLGCGSGILSIGALLLGAQSAYGVDIDENAAAIARENAQKNGFSAPQFDSAFGDIIRDEKLAERLGDGYDLVTANIVADVLIGMAPYFGGFLKPDGRLIVSGIIEDRADEVLTVLGMQGFVPLKRRSEKGWNAVLLARETTVR